MIRHSIALSLAFPTGAFATACQNTSETVEAPAPVQSQIIDDYLESLVENQSVMGAAGLIYMDGQEVYYGQAGQADREAERDWSRDTLVTIYSMTKPVTGVTLMTLYEEGLFDLEDPLADYLPEFDNVKVLQELDENGDLVLVDPNRPLKVMDILRQTACFGYGWEDHPAARLLNEAAVLDPSKPLAQFSEELADVPLYCHPGTQWKYGVAVDVQARLAEVLAGQPYEDLVTERVLAPLQMTDTSYFVPMSEKSRLAAVYNADGSGTLARVPDETVYGFMETKPVQINGGHGLISTIDDYMRFARMLQSEGSLDGVQILKPETVALMTRDHLPDGLEAKDFLPSKGQVGFGIDVAVRTGPPASTSEPYGVVGEFMWDGAASPFFWVDPENDLTAVFMTQIFPFNSQAQAGFRTAVYKAVDLYDEPVSEEAAEE